MRGWFDSHRSIVISAYQNMNLVMRLTRLLAQVGTKTSRKRDPRQHNPSRIPLDTGYIWYKQSKILP